MTRARLGWAPRSPGDAALATARSRVNQDLRETACKLNGRK